MYQRDARAGAFLGGDRVSGQDIRDQNGMSLAVISLARISPLNSFVLSYCCAIDRKYCEELTRSPWIG